MRRLTWTALGACLLLAGGVVLAQSPNPPTPVLDLVNAVVKATGAIVARPIANQIKELTAQDFNAAAGGGVADDTVAMQALFNSGKPILLTAGTYMVSCLTIPVGGLTLRGAQRSRTIIKQIAGSTCSTITVLVHVDDVSISEVTVDANNTGLYGIASDFNSTRWRVFNSNIKNAVGACLRFRTGTDMVASGNTITGCNGSGIVFTTSVTKFSATNNNINIENGGGIVFSVGLDGAITGNTIERSGPNGDCITGYHTDNRRVSITGNTCLNSNNHGIHVGGTQLTITGNVIDTPNLVGIYLFATTTGSHLDPEAPSTQITVSGNTVRNSVTSNQYGIRFDDVQDGAITGNVVTSNRAAGINVLLSTNVTITGNRVGPSDGQGILLRGTKNSIITGNLVTGSGADGYRFDNDTTNATGLGTVVSSGNTIIGNSAIGNNRDYIDANASGSNYFAFNNSASSIAGASPQFILGVGSIWNGTAAASSDLQLATLGGRQMLIKDTAATVNYFQISGSIAGVSPSITVNGSDTNRPFNLTGKGSGVVGISPGDFYASAKMTTNAGVVMLNMPTSCSGQPTKTLANIAGVVNICP